MNQDMIIAFLILGITIFAFVLDKIRMDIVALLALLSLHLTGLLTVNQVLAGFSNSTVIMITGLFVVGAGLFRTGVADWISQKLLGLAGTDQVSLIIVLMAGTGLLSGFLSNTGTVAVLLPAVVAAAIRIDVAPSKLLIPLAVAANVGGMLTLIGTPPNIVISDALEAAGEAPMGFFEFSLIGIPLLIVAVVYTVFIGRRFLPENKTKERHARASVSAEELVQSYQLEQSLYRVRVRPESKLVGKTLAQAAIGQDFGISVLHIDYPPIEDEEEEEDNRSPKIIEEIADRIRHRGHTSQHEAVAVTAPTAKTTIQANQRLLLRGELDAVSRLALKYNLGMDPLSDEERLQAEQDLLSLVEVLITPRSTLIGRTLEHTNFARKYGVQVLSVVRRGQPLADYTTQKLAFGDALLVTGVQKQVQLLQNEARNFVVVGESIAGGDKVQLNSKSFIAIGAMFLMMGLMLTKTVPAVIAVIIAALVMVIAKCITMEQAYRSISWESVVMIAAMLPMSTALQETGGAELIANTMVSVVGGNLVLLLGAMFILTVTFTQVISNTATSVLLAPIAIKAASDMGVPARAVMMMVAVGASTAFITPIASPVNMLVLNPGGYKFADFSKGGLPLAVIFMVISIILVPLIWG
ncbi:SLC13 family permease [Anaerolineales bacterium HSG6]|nr:SLC13 family permease [Anaerolineales bacterium HSG6]